MLVLIVAQDVFVTVLFPASGRKPLSSTIWAALPGYRETCRLPQTPQHPRLLRADRDRGGADRVVRAAHHRVGNDLPTRLGYRDPCILLVTDTSWATAIYYSGFLITTLGTGDVVPKTGLYRLLAILETVPGFVTISMVITYFLSVYSSLATRNAFAQGLHHATANTDDAAQLLVMLADGADLPDARSQLGATTPSLRQIFQTHRSYPVQALQIPWPPPGNFMAATGQLNVSGQSPVAAATLPAQQRATPGPDTRLVLQ